MKVVEKLSVANPPGGIFTHFPLNFELALPKGPRERQHSLGLAQWGNFVMSHVTLRFTNTKFLLD